MKVAIVHDVLQEFGGAERVVVSLKQIFPEADVFTSFYSPEKLGIHAKKFEGWNIITSWAQKVPLLPRLYSPLRFITPLIWEPFDFSAYDVVISSSGSFMSKGIITRPETVHICYLHHPPRYLYNYETAIEWQKHMPVRVYGHLINHGLRVWDYLSSQRVDLFIANSEETRRRIQKFYRMDGTVIYPPVSIPDRQEVVFSPQSEREYYITTSRLARAKHIDLLISAANKKKFRLKIIGRGRDEERLRGLAGETVEFHPRVEDAEFRTIYQKAKAFLFASVDDEFGIAPVEAMGFGLPVIAYASGGLKETVQHGENGFLYPELDEDSLIEQITALEGMSEERYGKMQEEARRRAEGYSFEKFREEICKLIQK